MSDKDNDLQVVSQEELMQIEQSALIAKKFPRDVEKAAAAVVKSATRSAEVAKLCFYALPRGGKTIEGPGIQLALLIAQKWGNLTVRTKITGETDREITATAIVRDEETNNTYMFEEKRRIVDKKGKKYSVDMIIMTGKAAQSVALRQCIFKAVSMLDFHDGIRQIQKVATGADTGKPLADRVDDAMEYFKKLGVSEDRILWSLQIADKGDITEENLVTLIGLSTAIKDKDTTINEAFPPTPKEKSDSKGEQLATDNLKD